MIRSNPTAIPLRASDLKLLQAEIEKRKAAPDSSSNTTSNGNDRANQGGSKAASGGTAAGVGGEGYNAVQEKDKDRQGRTVAERIGL